MGECMTQEDAMNMSNEQAVQILKPFHDMMLDQNGCPISDAFFALGKAIEALKREERNMNNKVNLCDSCRKVFPECESTANDIFFGNGVGNDNVCACPHYEPKERKKGKWILTEDDNYEYCTCSECGYQNGENWMIGSDIPFCANCGADMRGETDEQTKN